MRQRHYTTEAEIIAVIDEAIRARAVAEKEALFHLKLADLANRKASTASNGDAAYCLEQCKWEIKEHDRLIRRAERIERKLVQLKHTLAAFRTIDMFGNTGVVLQPQ